MNPLYLSLPASPALLQIRARKRVDRAMQVALAAALLAGLIKLACSLGAWLARMLVAARGAGMC